MKIRHQMGSLRHSNSSRRRGLCTALLALAAAAPLAAQPGAYELLDEVRRAYAEIGTYRDLGEIEHTTSVGGDVVEVSLQYFETAVRRDDDGFLWRVLQTRGERGYQERVLWRAGSEVFVYDSALGQWKPVPSLVGEIAHGFGEGGFDALVVPMTLAGGSGALSDPEGAAVEGPEACGESSCYVLFLSRMGGNVETQLWVDVESRLIREVEVRITSPVSDGGGGGRVRTIHLRLQLESVGESLEDSVLAFQAPSSAERVEEWRAVEEDEMDEVEEDAGVDPWPEMGYYDEITVELFSVTVRIVDASGAPLLDLEPRDLLVRAGGEELPVTALDWYGSRRDAGAALSAEQEELLLASGVTLPELAPEGRFVVLFLQTDMEPSRIQGHLRILPFVEELVQGLDPHDRVAIVHNDSRLELWHDFTRDRELIFEEFQRLVVRGGEPRLGRRRGAFALAEHFDHRAAREVTDTATGLELTAEALAQLPGEKEVIYIGYGISKFGGGDASMADSTRALRALAAARAILFALDVTQADYHTLGVGLKNLAVSTGGTYASIFHFPGQQLHKLARAISGHWVLTIDRSAAPEALGKLRIKLRDRKGEVRFKPVVLR